MQSALAAHLAQCVFTCMRPLLTQTANEMTALRQAVGCGPCVLLYFQMLILRIENVSSSFLFYCFVRELSDSMVKASEAHSRTTMEMLAALEQQALLHSLQHRVWQVSWSLCLTVTM